MLNLLLYIDNENINDEARERYFSIATQPNDRSKLFQKIEQVKIELSSKTETELILDDFGDTTGIKITRDELEDCIKELLKKPSILLKDVWRRQK